MPTGNLAQVFLLEDQLMEAFEQLSLRLAFTRPPQSVNQSGSKRLKIREDRWSLSLLRLTVIAFFYWFNSHVLPPPLGA